MGLPGITLPEDKASSTLLDARLLKMTRFTTVNLWTSVRCSLPTSSPRSTGKVVLPLKKSEHQALATLVSNVLSRPRSHERKDSSNPPKARTLPSQERPDSSVQNLPTDLSVIAAVNPATSRTPAPRPSPRFPSTTL